MPPKDKGSKGGGGKRPRTGNVNPQPEENIYMGLTRLTVAQKNKWKNLDKPKRTLQITRFLKIEVLQGLGMEELMRKLLRSTGLESFLGKSEAVYKRITLEFLSTLERVEDNGIRGIRFHLNDTLRTMSYDAIRTIFGVQEPRGEMVDRDGEVPFFYHELTGKPLRKAYLNTNTLTHPVWKMFYRGLSMTFFGNGEPTRMNALHIALMQTALPTNAIVPDWVDFFIRRCESFSTRPSGNIPVGGMITMIAQFFVRNPVVEAGKLGGPLYFTRPFLMKFDGYEPIFREVKSLTFAYGGGRTFRCCQGAVYPEGTRARDWRMPGVLDLNLDEAPEIEEQVGEEREEEEEARDQEMEDVGASGSQGGSFDSWGPMRAFLEDQEQMRMVREQSRHEFEDRRWDRLERRMDETDDRLEAIEDDLALGLRTQRHVVQWIQQTEPRMFEPVPDDYQAMLRSRAEARDQRRAARRAFRGDTSSSHQ